MTRYEGHEVRALTEKSLEGIFGESDDVDLGAVLRDTGDKKKETRI